MVSAASLIIVAAAAHASLYVGYGDSDYRFEVYYGDAYTFMATPYTYAYDNYDYFDYPFRVYDNGIYNYYQPGWYFDGYWNHPADYAFNTPTSYWTNWPGYDYYSPSYYPNYYYPADYYYYGGSWTYSPGWINTYGPMYYGSYFLPPGQATLVGQAYHPEKASDCSQATITADGATISAGNTYRATAYINNYSAEYFSISDVKVYVNGFDVTAGNAKFDKTIPDGSAGKATFDLTADPAAMDGSTKATISVYGTFADGTSCAGNDISKDIPILVNGNAEPAGASHGSLMQAPQQQGSYQQPQHGNTVDATIQNFTFSPSTITISTGDTVTWTNEDSAMHTVTSDRGNELDSGALATNGTYEHTFTEPGTYTYHCNFHPTMKGTIIVKNPETPVNTMHQLMPATTTPQNAAGYAVIDDPAYYSAKASQQHWTQANMEGLYQQYNPGNPDNGTGQNNYGYTQQSGYTHNQSTSGTDNSNGMATTQPTAQDCSGLSLEKKDFTVPMGGSATAYFQFNNYSPEDFKVDSVDSVEGSPSLSIDAGRNSPTIYAGETAAIKATASADTSTKAGDRSAYLKVNGHFASGLKCTVLSDNFYVTVTGGKNGNATIDVPTTAQLQGGSGFISFSVINNSGNDVKVTVYSYDASVSPQEFTFNAGETGPRTFAVNSLRANSGNVYYSLTSNGGEIVRKYTVMLKGTVAVQQSPAAPQANNTNSPGQGTLKSISGIASAGLAILGTNSLAIGVAIVLVILAFFAATRYGKPN